MAKTAKAAKGQAQPASQSARKRRSRDDAERMNRILIIGGVVAVILVALGVIAWGWYDTEVRALNKTVLRVGDTRVSLGHLERRMELQLPVPQNTSPLTFPEAVLDQLEQEALLIEGAGTLDIAVTEEEIAAEIRDRGGLAEEVDPEVFAAEFRRQVEESGLNESEYRFMLTGELLETKVQTYFAFLAPGTEPQVRARWIVTDVEGDANAAVLRITAGEDFVDVATDLSLSSGGATREADLEWTIRGAAPVDQEIQDYLFESEPGTLSDVIEVNGLFYVVDLIERDEARPLEDSQRRIVGSREMLVWQEALSQELGLERSLSRDDALRALEDVLG